MVAASMLLVAAMLAICSAESVWLPGWPSSSMAATVLSVRSNFLARFLVSVYVRGGPPIRTRAPEASRLNCSLALRCSDQVLRKDGSLMKIVPIIWRKRASSCREVGGQRTSRELNSLRKASKEAMLSGTPLRPAFSTSSRRLVTSVRSSALASSSSASRRARSLSPLRPHSSSNSAARLRST